MAKKNSDQLVQGTCHANEEQELNKIMKINLGCWLNYLTYPSDNSIVLTSE